jgi:hypothetical protein
MSSIGQQLKQRALQVQNAFLNEAISRGEIETRKNISDCFMFCFLFRFFTFFFFSSSKQLTIHWIPRVDRCSLSFANRSFMTQVSFLAFQTKAKKKKKNSNFLWFTHTDNRAEFVSRLQKKGFFVKEKKGFFIVSTTDAGTSEAVNETVVISDVNPGEFRTKVRLLVSL